MKIIFAIILAVVIIGGAFFLVGNTNSSGGDSIANVSVINGKQIIEITAKGGYKPRLSIAKAGLPTVIRFNTNGTFDCSSAVRIPSMNISLFLPNTGVKDVDLGVSKEGILNGTCGMGMYPFQIDFKS